MIVYLVGDQSWDGWSIDGIYTTRADAEESLKREREAWPQTPSCIHEVQLDRAFNAQEVKD